MIAIRLKSTPPHLTQQSSRLGLRRLKLRRVEIDFWRDETFNIDSEVTTQCPTFLFDRLAAKDYVPNVA
jgi:hypothetical protein